MFVLAQWQVTVPEEERSLRQLPQSYQVSTDFVSATRMTMSVTLRGSLRRTQEEDDEDGGYLAGFITAFFVLLLLVACIWRCCCKPKHETDALDLVMSAVMSKEGIRARQTNVCIRAPQQGALRRPGTHVPRAGARARASTHPRGRAASLKAALEACACCLRARRLSQRHVGQCRDVCGRRHGGSQLQRSSTEQRADAE